MPQELRLRGITTLEEANQFLREDYIAEFNRQFPVRAHCSRAAPLCPAGDKDLDVVFSVQQERVVNAGQHGAVGEQLAADRADALAGDAGGLPGDVCEHLDGTLDVSLRAACRGAI